jgi:oxygen-dependent protoporphyrinogen oxidase
MTRIAVVGGGIAGLAAAYELTRADVEVVVYEPDTVGGKVRTSPFAGRLVDEAADAFLARVPWAVELCDELGLTSTLVSPAAGAAYVWSNGALRQLPTGTVLGVPTDFDALERSGIVGGRVTPRPGDHALAPEDDIALGALVRAQLGDEVAERMVDPLVGSINAGDIDHLSIRACTPQLADAAMRDRELVAGLRAAPPAQPGPVFYAPSGGMGALVDALADRVPCVDHSLVTDLDGLDADAVVIAAPAFAAATLVKSAAPRAAELLAAIPYASVALVTLAYARSSVGRQLDGSGFLVPKPEGLLLTACSWASSKWEHLAGDPVIVRASAGRFGDERIFDLDDDALVARVVDELQLTSAFAGEPVEVRVNRWTRSFPQYEPGHLDRVDEIERELAAALPHVRLAGAALRGLGVPACIRQGREAARALIA